MTTGTPTETTARHPTTVDETRVDETRVDETRADETRADETRARETTGRSRRSVPRFGLSATQLVASALAAITATFVASYLGVSGTISGAAVASVATAIGNAVYAQSLRSTRDRVRVVVPATARFGPRTDPGSPTVVEPTQPPALPARPRPNRSEPSRPGPTPTWRRVALVAVGVFAAVLAIVTSVEVLAGRPVTDLVRGQAGSGTTLFGGAAATSGNNQPAPTITRTVTPSIVVTTPTITQTAPPVTKTATPTETTTSSPSTAPSTTSSPTGTPTTPQPSPTHAP